MRIQWQVAGRVFVALFAALSLAACAAAPILSESEMAALDVVNPQNTSRSVVTGGQPSAADLAVLKQSGIGTIINLRRDGEDLGFDEAEEAKALGFTYISVPVGMDNLDVETASKLREVLAQSTAPAFVHCGSGNRVGALYAIGAYHLDGESLESAIKKGQAAGLTGLEPRVREILAQ